MGVSKVHSRSEYLKSRGVLYFPVRPLWARLVSGFLWGIFLLSLICIVVIGLAYWMSSSAGPEGIFTVGFHMQIAAVVAGASLLSIVVFDLCCLMQDAESLPSSITLGKTYLPWYIWRYKRWYHIRRHRCKLLSYLDQCLASQQELKQDIGSDEIDVWLSQKEPCSVYFLLHGVSGGFRVLSRVLQVLERHGAAKVDELEDDAGVASDEQFFVDGIYSIHLQLVECRDDLYDLLCKGYIRGDEVVDMTEPEDILDLSIPDEIKDGSSSDAG